MSEQDRTIEDGFGGCYQKCDDPQCELEVVRPGKVQCNKCSDREGRYVLDTRTNTSGFLDMDTMVSVIEQQVEKIDTLESELAATKRECEGLREVVERVPRTADDVYITETSTVVYVIIPLVHRKSAPPIMAANVHLGSIDPEMRVETTVYHRPGQPTTLYYGIDESYSTREAAEQALAARDATEGDSNITSKGKSFPSSVKASGPGSAHQIGGEMEGGV